MEFSVNSNANIKFTNRLERLHRSAFPNAVRNTLNGAAFDMKMKSLPESFKQNFKAKKNTIPYFKKSNVVEKAKGFDILKMQSVIGMRNAGSPADRRFVEGMDKQESGGVIDDYLRYLKDARGGRLNSRVSSSNQFDKNRLVSDKGPYKKARNKKGKFIARGMVAFRERKPMFIESSKGKFLVSVVSVSTNASSKKLEFDFKFLAMQRKIKKTNLRATNYSKEASERTIAKMNNMFKKNAEFQIKKYMS